MFSPDFWNLFISLTVSVWAYCEIPKSNSYRVAYRYVAICFLSLLFFLISVWLFLMRWYVAQ